MSAKPHSEGKVFLDGINHIGMRAKHWPCHVVAVGGRASKATQNVRKGTFWKEIVCCCIHIHTQVLVIFFPRCCYILTIPM